MASILHRGILVLRISIICWLTLITTIVFAQDDGYVSLQQRLRSNIFLKVDASSTDVFVGEPIVVTYKLYSALPSESNITRNPTFNGFDVKSLGGADDHVASRETVDGVAFDVHTVRKLQLTPTKAGRLTIGALTMSNRVKLVDDNGNNDPILDGVNEGYSLNNGYFNISVSSVPISVIVTDLPNAAKPPRFDGLIGDFKMNVQIPKTTYEPGETGSLTITIIGTGDFSKVKQPEVNWPAGVEALPVKTDDAVNSSTSSGFKAFVIPFKTNKTGKFTIPSIRFSFFDARTNQYKTITNIPVTFHVVKDGALATSVTDEEQNTTEHYDTLLIGAGVLIALIIIFLLIKRSKRKRYPATIATKNIEKNRPINIAPAGSDTIIIDDVLRPAADTMHYTGNTFYTSLKQVMVNFFEQRFALPAALFNQDTLKNSMTDNAIAPAKQNEIINLLTEIDMHIYSGGGLDADKENLYTKTRNILSGL